jgi:hypothetical protein
MNFLQTPEIREFLQNSIYAREPHKSLATEFFCGKYTVDENYQVITEIPSCFTVEKVRERLRDDRFCKKCLGFEVHNVSCPESPWSQILIPSEAKELGSRSKEN